MSIVILAVSVGIDGVEVTKRPTWEEFIAELDAADRAREAEHRRHHKRATDLDTTPEQWTEERVARRRYEKPGKPEGPTYKFTHLLGTNLIWNGPNATRTANGDCRGCGRLEKLEYSMFCLHCERSGLDGLEAMKATRKPDDPRPEVKVAGPVTRKEKRKKLAG